MKKTIVFLCVHNSCRSQIAEALAKRKAVDFLEIFSAGTEIKNAINPDAVRLIKELYHIDMEETQSPKLIEEIPKVDFVITMGCNVICPTLPYTYETEDWGIEDPSGKSDEKFIEIIQEIESKVTNLLRRFKQE